MAKAEKLSFRIVDARQSTKVPFWQAISKMTAIFALLFAPGIMADSAAMQWAGFFVLAIMACLILIAMTFQSLTVEEAQEKLSKLAANEASE